MKIKDLRCLKSLHGGYIKDILSDRQREFNTMIGKLLLGTSFENKIVSIKSKFTAFMYLHALRKREQNPHTKMCQTDAYVKFVFYPSLP